MFLVEKKVKNYKFGKNTKKKKKKKKILQVTYYFIKNITIGYCL